MVSSYRYNLQKKINKTEIKTKVELYEGIIGQKRHDEHLAILVEAAENIQNKVVENEKMDSIAFSVIEKRGVLINRFSTKILF